MPDDVVRDALYYVDRAVTGVEPLALAVVKHYRATGVKPLAEKYGEDVVDLAREIHRSGEKPWPQQ